LTVFNKTNSRFFWEKKNTQDTFIDENFSLSDQPAVQQQLLTPSTHKNWIRPHTDCKISQKIRVKKETSTWAVSEATSSDEKQKRNSPDY
jgi:hypothetical protein